MTHKPTHPEKDALIGKALRRIDALGKRNGLLEGVETPGLKGPAPDADPESPATLPTEPDNPNAPPSLASRVSDDRALWLARYVVPNEPWLRAQITRWRLPHDLEADDIIQEAYAKLATVDSIEQIRHPKAYLYSTARTLMLMHLRRSRIVSIRAIGDIADFDFAADEPTPETQVSDREQLHLLAGAIAELPEPSRQAFILRVIDGLSHRDIGNRLGISENAVQKSIAKSLGLLIKRLGRGGNCSPKAST